MRNRLSAEKLQKCPSHLAEYLLKVTYTGPGETGASVKLRVSPKTASQRLESGDEHCRMHRLIHFGELDLATADFPVEHRN